MTVRIGIESNAYRVTDPDAPDLARGFLRMKEHGYDCVDFQAFTDTEAPLFRCSWDERRKKLGRVLKCAKDAGIGIFQSHGPWRWPPDDDTDEKRAERFDKMSQSLDGAALLECPYLVIHPVMPFGWESDPEPERFRAINLDFFSRLAERARQAGTVICLENMPMPGLSLASPGQILRFVKEIDSPYLRVCLDTGHAVMFEDPADSVMLTGSEYLRVLHLHDNDGKRDLHWLPYFGVVQWERFCKALGQIGYDGVMSLETHASDRLPAGPRELFDLGVAGVAKELARMTSV